MTLGFWQANTITTHDGLKLQSRIFKNTPSQNFLLIVHGFGEYGERYTQISEQLAQAGINVITYDLRGMGRSAGPRAWVPSFDFFLRDLDDVVESYGLRKARKVFLLGHSLGGLITLHWAMKRLWSGPGIFLSSPFLGFREPGWIIAMLSLLSRLGAGDQYLSRPVNPRLLTHDLKLALAYESDPLVLKKISFGLVREVFSAQIELRKAEALPLKAPCRFLLAGQEFVVDKAAALQLFQKIASPSKTIKVYESYYHESLNEPNSASLRDLIASIRSLI